VARQQGATDFEINEVVTIAMTVGAHKIRLMAEKGQSVVGKPEPSKVEETSGTT
jgi:hypothetical protein